MVQVCTYYVPKADYKNQIAEQLITFFILLIFDFRYTGSLLLSAGLLTQCIIGPVPEILRDSCSSIWCSGCLGGCMISRLAAEYS